METKAPSGRQALDRVMSLGAEGLRPDVVLMDLEMEPVDGIEATREIRSRYPEVEVVALTSFVEEDRVHAALDAGAAGYLLKARGSHRPIATGCSSRSSVLVTTPKARGSASGWPSPAGSSRLCTAS